ncbi:5-oxoprolinase subunit PxpA [Allomuricauda sp. M10]|uniref:5-oxoprolinase subunit PxpA n=1 Tax=Allomuricauda sp. M10 TaxID=2683292 RepID=UPI001D18692D|nr:5-oxoprolinase subunit PxpA [Muricauda sp. M10]
MGTFSIDINCDVGEGIGNEAQIFPFISSCNIACGGHAGTEESMSEVVDLAMENGVKIGAHPSYPDKENFGREVLDISKQALIQSIKEQMFTFQTILNQKDAQLHHIKAHGALYNQTAKDGELAKTYLEAISTYKGEAILYVPFGSVVAELAMEMGFQIWYEAFADRNYNADLSLVSRKLPNSLIENPSLVVEHILPIIKNHKVKAVNNEFVKIEAKTLCVHGDTASALEILMYLSQELPNQQVQIQK